MNNLEELKKEIQKHTKEQVMSVLLKQVKSAKFISRPSIVKNIIKEYDPDVEETDFNTNGYQWDYWMEFTLSNDTKLMLCGDGFYELECTLSINE